jgi:hypothetical protein
MSFVSSAALSGPAEASRPRARSALRRGAAMLVGVVTIDRLLVTGLCTASLAFFGVAYSISMHDPDYFSRRLLASMRPSDVDPIVTGAIEAAPGGGEAMPVAQIVRSPAPVAADFQIVMVFQDEAILATSQELWRVKVGSIVPGLGKVLAIDATETGGTVQATEATLRSVAQ